MKIVTIVGARPQFIKAGSVSREIQKQNSSGKNIKEVIVHTGQHYDENMSEIFFDEMEIPKPNYFLGIGGKSHGAMTGQMLEKIEEVLLKEKPDWVLVYGDTNSTLAGALAASKLHIKIAHVEAGLRSYNMKMPEETNRILTDRLSSILFCPTTTAVENLRQEGVSYQNSEIVLVGDVMHDGAIFYSEFAQKPDFIESDEDYLLATIHRAENTDNPTKLSNIIGALNTIAKNTKVILPLHPRTKKLLEQSRYDTSNLTIVEPVGYLNMIWLIKNCSIVITDSGGLQKEAFFFNKFCITIREETEWQELVSIGANKTVGSDPTNISRTFNSFRKQKFELKNKKPYGDGNACKKIVERLLDS